MRSAKNHYFLLPLILIFAVIGCNFSKTADTGSSENTSKETDVVKNEDQSADPKDGNDSATIPDMDFPEGNNTEPDPENAGGDKTTVVRFAKGATAGNYKGSIAQDKTYTYIVDAGKGQTMNIELSSSQDNAGMYIKKPGGGFLGDANESEWTNNYSGKLPVSGKYKVVVTTSRGMANFMLSLSIKGGTEQSPADNSSTVESGGGLTTVVKFPKGGTFATYKSAVIRGERNKYILAASGG
ncbi:MAG: hypothetical protein KDB79_14125, partial [Acidobacteria bacterium]|nr:hypothetical protein [Acidobacteriota bacterium]